MDLPKPRPVPSRQPMPVLVAGIGGASLGTEIAKALQAAGRYEIFGCDISRAAFGHYQEDFAETYLVDRGRYVNQIRALCRERRIRAVVPGGEQPARLLAAAREQIGAEGALLASNSPRVVSICSDKARLFRWLSEQGVPSPRVVAADDRHRLDACTYPCVVKPSTDSGGSNFVFLARDRGETELYVDYLLAQGLEPLVQEYIPLDEGEFTIGVLHLPDGTLAGCVALRRSFEAKLSVQARTPFGLISSGYSQGRIDDFPGIRRQAERIAGLLGSRGPLNIQGRVRDGVLLPFEINPRFSASTYLRTLAGFNEVDAYLQAAVYGIGPPKFAVRPGYYLRSLSQVVVDKGRLIGDDAAPGRDAPA